MAIRIRATRLHVRQEQPDNRSNWREFINALEPLVYRWFRRYAFGRMPLRSIVHDVWIVCIILQVLLALVLLTKRVWEKYPIFSAYVFFSLFEAGILYVLAEKAMLYFYIFWICEAIGLFLGLAVVREIFIKLFSPHPALRKLATLIFRVAVAALLVLAGGVIYAQSADARSIANAVLLAAEATRIIEVGLIMFLFLCSSAFGLHWRQNLFGIALGLGTLAAVELVTVSFVGHVSPTIAQALSLVRVSSFGASLLIWTGYLWAPERVSTTGEVPQRAQLEQWNQAVMELISK